MSENTVVCSECGEHVPKKRFCFECGSQIVATGPPATSVNISTPVQVTDSVSSDVGLNESAGGRNAITASDTLNNPSTQAQTSTRTSTASSTAPSGTDDVNHKGTSGGSAISPPSSYADATRSNQGERKENSQRNNQGNSSNITNTPAGGSAGGPEKLKYNVTMTRSQTKSDSGTVNSGSGEV